MPINKLLSTVLSLSLSTTEGRNNSFRGLRVGMSGSIVRNACVREKDLAKREGFCSATVGKLDYVRRHNLSLLPT